MLRDMQRKNQIVKLKEKLLFTVHFSHWQRWRNANSIQVALQHHSTFFAAMTFHGCFPWRITSKSSKAPCSSFRELKKSCALCILANSKLGLITSRRGGGVAAFQFVLCIVIHTLWSTYLGTCTCLIGMIVPRVSTSSCKNLDQNLDPMQICILFTMVMVGMT